MSDPIKSVDELVQVRENNIKPTLVVNWYKPTGKWYARCELEVPDDLPGGSDSIERFVLTNQDQLQKSFSLGSWYMTTTIVNQGKADCRFFEYMFKYGGCK